MKYKGLIKAVLISITFFILILTGTKASAEDGIVSGNDSPATAVDVAVLPYQATYRPAEGQSEAWFKVDITKKSSLHIVSNYYYYYNNHHIYTEDSLSMENPQPIHSGNYPYWYYGYYSNSSFKLEPGAYYVRITGANSETPISLSLLEEDEMENNDTWQSAFNYTFGQEKNYYISSYNDVDWIKLEVKERGTLDFRKTSDCIFDLYSEQTLLEGKNEYLYSSVQLGNNALNKILNPGNYYLKLHRENTSYPYETGMGKMRIDFILQDSLENNDTYDNAYLFPLGEQREINLSADEDTDWFKIVIGEKGGTLKFHYDSNEPFLVGHNLYSQDSMNSGNNQPMVDYTTHYDPVNTSSNQYHYRYFSYRLAPGIYYLALYSGIDYGYASNYKNKIKLTLDVTNDTFENNDTWQNAKDFKIGETKSINLDAYNDQDWMKFELSQSGIVNFKFNNTSNQSSGTYCYIYAKQEDGSPSANPIASYLLNNSQKEANCNFYAGTYYIKFMSQWHDKSIYPYNYEGYDHSYYNTNNLITLNFTPNPIGGNYSPQTAFEFPLGQEKEMVSIPGQWSWFKIVLNERNNLIVRLDKQNGYSQYIGYELFTENQIAQSSGPLYSTYWYYSNNYHTIYDLAPGTYYLKVNDGWANDNIFNIKYKILIGTSSQYINRPIIHRIDLIGDQYSTEVFTDIKVNFDMPMDPRSFTKDSVKLMSLGQEVAIDFDYNEASNKLVIYPVNRLSYETKYSILISDPVKSRDNGLTLGQPYYYEFVTKSKPQIIEPMKYGKIGGYVKMPEELKKLSRAAEVHITGNNFSRIIYLTEGRSFYVPNVPVGTYKVRVIVPLFIDDVKTVTVEENYDIFTELNPKIGDLNCDGIINVFDLTILSKNYNQSVE